jgi:hypothetical protein
MVVVSLHVKNEKGHSACALWPSESLLVTASTTNQLILPRHTGARCQPNGSQRAGDVTYRVREMEHAWESTEMRRRVNRNFHPLDARWTFADRLPVGVEE